MSTSRLLRSSAPRTTARRSRCLAFALALLCAMCMPVLHVHGDATPGDDNVAWIHAH